MIFYPSLGHGAIGHGTVELTAGNSVVSGGSYIISCETGVYTLTGQNANLKKSKLLTAQSGSYSLVGNDATLLKSKRIVAQSGAYSFTGNNANLTWTGTGNAYTLTCLTGIYNLVGQDADLKRARRIVALTGAYSFVGYSAELTNSDGTVRPKYPLAGITCTFPLAVLPSIGTSYEATGAALFDDDMANNQFDESMNIAYWFDEMMGAVTEGTYIANQYPLTGIENTLPLANINKIYPLQSIERAYP